MNEHAINLLWIWYGVFGLLLVGIGGGIAWHKDQSEAVGLLVLAGFFWPILLPFVIVGACTVCVCRWLGIKKG